MGMLHQQKRKNHFVFLPLVILLAVCALLFIGLQQDPQKIASALIGKPVPTFSQADLLRTERRVTQQDLPQQTFLLNVWGSWCAYCKKEHPFLMQLAKSMPIVGLNYRDNPQNALAMLNQLGNPFQLVINDSRGELALNLGVDGAPETYLIDQYGVIRYRYSGPLTPEVWQEMFIPEWQKLEAENAKVR
ncbi:DsbE family thiol:disulfide interchange protein [Pasteurella multocida]|uniref:DsbE family thiol:disulfide interchange protein n=1 Tax=Pasteurella multocida TaxID=747 RepID=UPI000BBD40DF|nr:DsbE family thiol:disulfide interchange protein [Pasteurella multocida]ATF74510.1 thiol:disulfide interchange protein [Pasteurella multocida]ATN16911.1 DsbE family thiol:disulfide interchange protein [Pasteurella multocida]MDY0498383.1 DsbE family thiol:disulfide interchange protein [Pasteurella multocida]MDY0577339.1 DsbE family thiol:disulfide interchange protein [Pasteurella multocida]MDY0655052.1 DsbE family thiol:disulfide interchange protein [Pasteurella multocida]